MGKTLLELFKKESLNEIGNAPGVPVPSNGNTPADKYAVRNSKDIPVSSASPYMDTSFGLLNKLRLSKGLTSRMSETFLEEEATGLRPLRTLAIPVIYGTDSIRIIGGGTQDVKVMKQAAGSSGTGLGQSSPNQTPTTGKIANFVSNVGKKVDQIADKVKTELGFSRPLYPSSFVGEKDFKDGATDRIPETLAKIKGDSSATVLGKLLIDSARGTPEQIAKQTLGGAINLGKTAVRNTIFGGGTPSNSTDAASLTRTNSNVRQHTAEYQGDLLGWKSVAISTNNYTEFDEDVQKYPTQNSPLRLGYINDQTTEIGKILDQLRPAKLKGKTKGELKKDVYYSSPSGIHTTPYGKFYTNVVSLEGRGIHTDRDVLNQTGRFAEKELKDIRVNNVAIKDLDLIPLRFQRMNDKSGVYLRAVLSGLSETFTPNWEGSNTIGNPFKFYNYTGVERKVGFTVKLYAMSQLELIMMWRRLEYLAKMTYPFSYTGAGAVEPTLFWLTLGSMYVDKPAILTSLTYTVDDNTTWEIGGTKAKIKEGNFTDEFRRVFFGDIDNGKEYSKENGSGDEPKIDFDDNVIINSGSYSDSPVYATQKLVNKPKESLPTDIEMDQYRLPKIISAQFDVTFLESKNLTDYNIYGYGRPLTYSHEDKAADTK